MWRVFVVFVVDRCDLRQRLLLQGAPETLQVQLLLQRAPPPLPRAGGHGARALAAHGDQGLGAQLRDSKRHCVSVTGARQAISQP